MGVPDWNKPSFVIDERELAVEDDGHVFRPAHESGLPFDTSSIDAVRVVERVTGVAYYSETRNLDIPLSQIIEYANDTEYEIRNIYDLESLAEDMSTEMEFDDYNDDIEYTDHESSDFSIEDSTVI